MYASSLQYKYFLAIWNVSDSHLRILTYEIDIDLLLFMT